MTHRALPAAGVVGAGRTPSCRRVTRSSVVRQSKLQSERHAWLAANSFSPRFQVTQAGFKMEAEDYPFTKVCLQTLWEHQAVHTRSHHSGLVSLTLTSLIFEGFSLLRVLMLPCFQRGQKAETQIHNMQQVSQVLAGGPSPRVRRALCIIPWASRNWASTLPDPLACCSQGALAEQGLPTSWSSCPGCCSSGGMVGRGNIEELQAPDEHKQ